MKYFSVKVWSLTSFFLALGMISLWVMVRLLDSLLHSSHEVIVWFLASAGCLKQIFLSLHHRDCHLRRPRRSCRNVVTGKPKPKGAWTVSATFFLKFRDAYVRLMFVEAKTVAQIVGRDQATPFISEADAWLAVHQHHLRSDWCEVVPASAAMKEAA